MNLAIRGIAPNLGDVPADTFNKESASWFWGRLQRRNPHLTKKTGVLQMLIWCIQGGEATKSANKQCQLRVDFKHGEQTSENGVGLIYFGQLAPSSGGGEEYKIRRKL